MRHVQLPPGLVVGAVSVSDLRTAPASWLDDARAGVPVIVFGFGPRDEVRALGLLTSVPPGLAPLADALAAEIADRRKLGRRQNAAQWRSGSRSGSQLTSDETTAGQAADSTPAATRICRALCMVAARLYPREHPRAALRMLLADDHYPQGAEDAEAIALAAGLGPEPERALPPPRPVPPGLADDRRPVRNTVTYPDGSALGAPRNERMRAEAAEADRAYATHAGAALQSRDNWISEPAAAFRERAGITGLGTPDLKGSTD
jgi:hypothetical protein